MKLKQVVITLIGLLLLSDACAGSWVKGIYITQSTASNRRALSFLIRQAKKHSINSFVIDISHPSRRYRNNIKLVRRNNIKYVARIVVFPHGGKHAQVTSKTYWQRKYRLADYAISLGAKEIQLDYIRYRSSTRASAQNAKNIYRVIKWFKSKLAKRHIPLQIDIFGVVSFGHAKHIGQNIKLFANSVDVVCPMVYPSHYEPYKKHARTPYQTVRSSLFALKSQFKGKPSFKIIPFIELYNYRYPLSRKAKLNYIYQQIKAVQDSGVAGWYVWSPTNKYWYLFKTLQTYKLK